MDLKTIKVYEEDWERFTLLRTKARMASRDLFKKILDVYTKEKSEQNAM